jgi:multiple sugar transport system substrate-binding protein
MLEIHNLKHRSRLNRESGRSRIAVVAAIATAIGLVVSTSLVNASAAPKPKALSKASIDFYMGPYAATTDGAMKKIISSFQKANPNVKVRYQTAPWDTYDTKMGTAAKAGDGPGLAMQYTWGKYGADGLLNPIKSWVSPAVRKDLIPVFVNPKEKWAIPDLASVRGVFHNTAIATAAGVTSTPQTFDALKAAALKIKASNPGVTPLGFVTTSDDVGASFSYYLFGAGGEWIDDEGNFLVDSTASIAALTYLKDLYDNKLIEQDVTANRGTQEERFQAGQTAILPTGNFFVKTLKTNMPNLKYKVGALPRQSGVKPFGVGVTDYFVSFKQGNKAQTAASTALMDHLFKPSNYVAWLAADGFLPVTQSAIEPYRKAAPEMASFLDNLASSKFYPGGDVRWAKVTSIMSEAVQNVFLGRTSVAEGLKSAQKQIDALPKA